MPLPSKDALRKGARGAFVAFACIAACASVHAQSTPLLSEVQTIATASTGVPIEHEVDISAAGTYQIILTDLGALLTPTAPLSSVKLAVTSGGTLVGTPLVGAGTLTLNAAAAGTYVIHVVGKPGTGIGSGPIGIQVLSGTTTVDSFSDNIALPAQPLPGQEVALNDSFPIATSGTYLVVLQDLGIPQSLGNGALTLLLVDEATQTPVQVLPDPANNNALQANVALQSGHTYAVFAIGQAPAGVSGGLYSVAVIPPGGGTPAYAKTVPIGSTTLLGSPTLTAGAHTIAVTDLKYPAALSQVEVAVVLNGQFAAPVMGASTQSFAAAAGTYQVYGSATAATAAPGAGSYSVQVQPQGGAPELSVARAVSAAGSALKPYSFDTTVATAGSYSVNLTNFSFPVSLVSVGLGVVQAGALLASPLSAAGSSNIAAAAGPLSLVAFAQADPVQGGLFDINLAASGSTTPVFDVTQGVVGSSLAFVAHPVTVTTAGKYILSTSDVAFPAGFANFAVMLTQGGNTVGTIYGTDQITVTASPGTYSVNLIAQPAGGDDAGTYSVMMSPVPPAPTVTLTSSASSVAQGGTATLTWSSQNATTCTASGGWTGGQALNGTVTTSALTSDTTFTLTCVGGGGSTAQSVTVTVGAASSGSKGGGGGFDSLSLLMLAILVVGRRGRRVLRVSYI